MNSINNIILLDSNTDISKISLSDYDELKIISFDFETHKILNKKKIQHLISDELLSDTNLLMIQKMLIYFLNGIMKNQLKNT